MLSVLKSLENITRGEGLPPGQCPWGQVMALDGDDGKQPPWSEAEGPVAGVGQTPPVMLGRGPWEEAPAGCGVGPPVLTSPRSLARVSRTWPCLSEAERGSRPCFCHQVAEMGTHTVLPAREVHLPPGQVQRGARWLGGGSRYREALRLLVQVQPDPLAAFLGQRLWEMGPENRYFYHVPRG